jgi:hypothetical protein
MQRLFLIFSLLIAYQSLWSQNISVASFKILPTNLDARVNFPVKDQNGDLCAIIKVVTTQTGFSFDCGQIGIIKTIQKPSEIWVYVPYGAKRLTISHPNLGILRDYQLPIPIEKATAYELVLISGRVITSVEETIVSQWLVITPEPANAMIYINEKFVKNGTYQAKLKPGSYTYRVEAAKYHNEAGKIEIADSKKEVKVVLKAAFGYLSVTSEPELGAQIFIDGETINKVTPCEQIPLSSGEHTVQVIKDNFQPVKQRVTITDGNITNVKLTLNPNFSEVNILSTAGAEIFIDNEQMAKGVWQGKLSAGVHSLEARLEKCKTARKDIEVVAGESQSIQLIPTPLFGSLDIISDPAGALIGLIEKTYGYTPNTINDLSVGSYSLRLILKGYQAMDTAVVIAEGKTTEINLTLKSLSPNITKPIAEKTKTKISISPTEINLGSTYYKHKKAKAFWMVSGLLSLSAGAFTYLQAGKYYTQYQSATTDADALEKKVKTFDTVYPVCFALAGASGVGFIIQTKKQGKSKSQTLGLYPRPVFDGAGLGLVYNF